MDQRAGEKAGRNMRFANGDILRIAMEQSAIDANCRAEDFLRAENVVVVSAASPGARGYPGAACSLLGGAV